MKHLKTKLMASVAMLMVATVMLSSASFAWFTISTAPEVRGVNTQLASNGNLEIALANVTYDATNKKFTYVLPAASTDSDTGKNITWGNNIDLSKYFATASTAVKNLRPVSFTTPSEAAPKVSAPVFGDDGRMKEVSDLNPSTTAVDADSADAGKVIEYKDGTTAWAYRTDFMLRTNTAGKILLADSAKDLGNNSNGSGCYIKDQDGADQAYLKDIRVYAVVRKISQDGEAGDFVWEGTLLYNKQFNSDALFTAEPNQIYVVQTYFLWDGENLSNAEMAEKNQDVKINIQFEHNDADGNEDLKSLLNPSSPS